jgi:hypothetical protein
LTSRLVSKSSPQDKICKNAGRQERYSEIIGRTQVNRPPSHKYGENSGDPVHFSSTQSSELQIGDHALGPARASQRPAICRLNRPVLNRSDVSSGSGSDAGYAMASGEMTFALSRSCGKSLGFKVTMKSAFPSSLQRQNGSSLGSGEISTEA